MNSSRRPSRQTRPSLPNWRQRQLLHLLRYGRQIKLDQVEQLIFNHDGWISFEELSHMAEEVGISQILLPSLLRQLCRRGVVVGHDSRYIHRDNHYDELEDQ